MLNGLVDFGDDDGFSFQAGLGAGWAKAKLIDDKDGAFAWQAILGFTYAISPNIDLGMRYKYFSTGNLHFADDSNSIAFQRAVTVTRPPPGVPVIVIQDVRADVFTDLSTKFKVA